MIARSERAYLIEGVLRDIRNDARACNTLRGFTVLPAQVEQASGSCEVAVRNGGSRVLVGVKAEIATLDDDNDNDDNVDGAGAAPAADTTTTTVDVASKTTTSHRADGTDATQTQQRGASRGGRIICTVECAPSVARFLDSGEATERCTLYAEYANRLLNGSNGANGGGGIDLGALAIIPNACAWVLHVDCLVLEYGGNLLDTIMAAIRGALANTRLPRVDLVESDGVYDFQLGDDETELVPGADTIPITVSFYKIGARHVLDPTPLEELCSECQLAVSVARNGRTVLVEKFGGGAVRPHELVEYLKVARTVAPQFELRSMYGG